MTFGPITAAAVVLQPNRYDHPSGACSASHTITTRPLWDTTLRQQIPQATGQVGPECMRWSRCVPRPCARVRHDRSGLSSASATLVTCQLLFRRPRESSGRTHRTVAAASAVARSVFIDARIVTTMLIRK